MMQAMQLSLWDAPAPTEQPESAPSGRPELPPGGHYVDEVIVTTFDTRDWRPERREEIAVHLLGGIEFHKLNNGKYVAFHAISSAVVDDYVLVAYQYLCTDHEFYLHLPHTPVEQLMDEWSKSGGQDYADDEDEEEDVA